MARNDDNDEDNEDDNGSDLESRLKLLGRMTQTHFGFLDSFHCNHGFTKFTGDKRTQAYDKIMFFLFSRKKTTSANNFDNEAWYSLNTTTGNDVTSEFQ